LSITYSSIVLVFLTKILEKGKAKNRLSGIMKKLKIESVFRGNTDKRLTVKHLKVIIIDIFNIVYF
jgi:3-deoxy-D-manno-octulosonate 8-phosphate phosphatase KdsC-like HAD superfamily phosphatase